eukprot:NODE_46_length_32145_cov_0.918711.p25 type:complete len:157 gc:universal NODE_46_length_32145_cov_0.918711:20416-19946(-)
MEDNHEIIPLVNIKPELNLIKCIYQEKTYEVQIEPYTFVNELIPAELEGNFDIIHFGTKLKLNKSVAFYSSRIKQYGNMVHLTPPTISDPLQMTAQNVSAVTPDDLYIYLLMGVLSGFIFSVFTMIPLRIKSDEYTIFKAGCVIGLIINSGLKIFL